MHTACFPWPQRWQKAAEIIMLLQSYTLCKWKPERITSFVRDDITISQCYLNLNVLERGVVQQCSTMRSLTGGGASLKFCFFFPNLEMTILGFDSFHGDWIIVWSQIFTKAPKAAPCLYVVGVYHHKICLIYLLTITCSRACPTMRSLNWGGGRHSSRNIEICPNPENPGERTDPTWPNTQTWSHGCSLKGGSTVVDYADWLLNTSIPCKSFLSFNSVKKSNYPISCWK